VLTSEKLADMRRTTIDFMLNSVRVVAEERDTEQAIVIWLQLAFRGM